MLNMLMRLQTAEHADGTCMLYTHLYWGSSPFSNVLMRTGGVRSQPEPKRNWLAMHSLRGLWIYRLTVRKKNQETHSEGCEASSTGEYPCCQEWAGRNESCLNEGQLGLPHIEMTKYETK